MSTLDDSPPSPRHRHVRFPAAPTAPVFGNEAISLPTLAKLDRIRIYSWSWIRACRKPSHFLSATRNTPSVARAQSLPSFSWRLCLFVFWLGRKALSAPAADKARLVQLHALLCNGPLAAPDRLVDCFRSIHLVSLLKFLSTGWIASAWNFPRHCRHRGLDSSVPGLVLVLPSPTRCRKKLRRLK